MSTTRARTSRRRTRTAPVSLARTPWALATVAVLVLVALFAVYRSEEHSAAGGGPAGGGDRYAVGSPGVGAMAPDFALPAALPAALPLGAAAGAPATVRLSDFRGRTVLLYFHEGLGCQPCWTQIRDLQRDPVALRAAGIDQLLTITSGPADLVARKVADDKLTEPALVDADLAVSRDYRANRYGMMGDSRDGHSFVLVGPDGRIQWRADYGGAPDYTMYVPVDQLLADLRAGRRAA